MVEPSKRLPIETIIDEIVSLFHLLQALAVTIHSDIGLTAAKRGLLKGVEMLGPQTVPQMAYVRNVSRQYIQTIVNQLQSAGLVEIIPNPLHRRSGIVKLTPHGERFLTLITEKEKKLLSGLTIEIGDDNLRQTVEVLQKIKGFFDNIRLENISHKTKKGSVEC